MSQPVRIPADVDMADRVLGPLTARQLAILAATGLALYLGWIVTEPFVPLPVFLVLAVPLGATATILALGQRDGVSLDRMLLAAIRQHLRPRHRVSAPEGIQPAPDWLTANAGNRTTGSDLQGAEEARISPSALRLPAEAITDTGVVDLGPDGLAVVAVVATVNFALRTPSEQDSLVGSFGRYLHSLTGLVQVLVRTQRLDLSGQIGELRARAGGLPHPALEAAAREHADYLVQLGEQTDLLRRQVLLVLREPVGITAPTGGLGAASPLAVLTSLTHRHRRARRDRGPVNVGVRRAAESRLVRRLGEAGELLGAAGIVVTPLDAGQATAVLAAACNPDTLLPPSAVLAGADDVITTAASDDPAGADESRYFGTQRTGWDYGPDGDIDDWDDDEDDFDDKGRS